MKRKKLSLSSFLLIVLFFTGIIGVFSVNVIGVSNDLDYAFATNSIIDTENPQFYNQTYLEEYVNFNVRNTTTVIPANLSDTTFSFTNDTIGENPIGWDLNEAGGSINVFENLFGHEMVLELNDTNGGANILAEQVFADQPSGTIEFWIDFTDVTKTFNIWITDGGGSTHSVYVFVDNSLFYYLDVGSTEIVAVSNNIWYHVKIDFECGGGSYLGLSADTFYITINGKQYGAYNIRGNPVNMDGLMFTTGTADSNYKGYIDGIGYSWDSNYNIGDNFYPNRTINDSPKEMDKFEFALEGINDAFDVGDDNPSGWSDIEQSGGDQVNVGSYPADIDKKVSVICDSSTDTRGLNRDFSVSGEFIEVNFTHEYSLLTGTGGTNFYIDSSDDTLIVSLRMLINGEVEWYDGANWNEIFNGLTTSEVYTFVFMIDYSNEICVFDYYIDLVYQDSYVFSLLDVGKEGLGTVQMTHELVTDDEVRFEIDSIGVYVDGISLADTEFSYLTLEIGKNWSFQENNLFWINATGYFSIHATDYIIGTYSIPHVAGMDVPLETVKTVQTYNGELGLTDLYSTEMTEYPTGINNSFLVFYLSSGNISLTSLSIDGVLLKEGSNEYSLELIVSNCEGYFYVENSELHYVVIYNDIGLEYIQATFNIDDVLTENRSVQFTSDKFGGSRAYFRLSYTDDTSTTLSFSDSKRTIGIILPQSKEIGELIILITDDDKLNVGTSTGYIKDISLIYYPDISITITTINLIDVMVPLMILLIPTFVIYKKFGENAIIPMFMLMSIICLIAELVPIWLFFILMFGSVIMLYTKKKIEASNVISI